MAQLPGVWKTQCTQTSEGAVRSGGRPRYYSNALSTPAVPSKAECLSDLRLFQLVRDGTYNEVLDELEAAAPHDAEAAWMKTKLLRLVQRHRQKSYGSIRNSVTSKKTELTPDVTASAAPSNPDLQLPSLERPSSEVLAARMMQNLAVLHKLQPRELTDEEFRATHEKLFVPEKVYAEKELSQSRASSPQAFVPASSPLPATSQPLSAELSRGSGASPPAELSRGSTASSKGTSRGKGQSDPSFVNRKSWVFQPEVPANDGSRRDRRMNSPVGDRSGEWSRLSYTALDAPKSHGFWGTAWNHPQDIFKSRPGIDCQCIKTINSKEYGKVSSLMRTLTDQLRASNDISTVNQTLRLQDPPKMGSVRNARVSAQLEAEIHVQQFREHRLEQSRKIENEASSGDQVHDELDQVLSATVREAEGMWMAAVDSTPPVAEISATRKDAAKQLRLAVEQHGKKKNEKYKGVILEIWKNDVIGASLRREEAATLSIHQTLLHMEEHAARLAKVQHEKGEKRVLAAEIAVQRAEQEASSHQDRMDEEVQAHKVSSEKRAVVQAQRDELSNQADEYEKEVNQLQKEIAGHKEQMKNLEAEAYQDAQRGKADLVKEKKEKAEEFRTLSNGLRTKMDKVHEKLAKTSRKLDLVSGDLASIENLALKDEARLEETQKVCQRDRERIQELQEKLAEEQNSELIVRQLADDRKLRVDKARRIVEQMFGDGGTERAGQAASGDSSGGQETDEASGEQISSVSVIDRLRSNSLSLVAKIIMSSEDPDISTEEQRPVYLGERLEGKRQGFGILQYPAGAEYMGEFKDDLPSGIGIERYADGTTYEGSFLNGERHGMGVYTIATNVAYLGIFRGGRRTGPGVMCIATRSASVPYWPVVVCVCRADSFEARSAAKFRTDCLQNALLIADVGLAQQSALESAKRARSIVLTDFFSGQEKSQIDARHYLGLSVVPKNPSLQAFRGSSSFLEARTAVMAKMHDVKAVARLAATPGGQKAVKRAKDRSPMPFQKGEGRRHAASIYGSSPAGSAFYKT